MYYYKYICISINKQILWIKIMADKVLDDFTEIKSSIPEGYSGEEEDPGTVMSVLLHICVYLYPLVFLSGLILSIYNLYNQGFLWLTLPAFIVAWIAGDVLTGLVHWLCDTYGTVNTPVFGQTLIRNFRSHHKYPKDICVSPFVYTVGYVAVVSLVTLPPLVYFMIKMPGSVFLSSLSFTYTLVTFLTVMTNQFHKWAHLDSDKVPSYIQFLQKKKIILDPIHHKEHHTNPFNSNYCITHGLANPFLEKIGFFRKLEKIIAKLGFHPAV